MQMTCQPLNRIWPWPSSWLLVIAVAILPYPVVNFCGLELAEIKARMPPQLFWPRLIHSAQSRVWVSRQEGQKNSSSNSYTLRHKHSATPLPAYGQLPPLFRQQNATRETRPQECTWRNTTKLSIKELATCFG